VLLFIYFPMVW